METRVGLSTDLSALPRVQQLFVIIINFNKYASIHSQDISDLDVFC